MRRDGAGAGEEFGFDTVGHRDSSEKWKQSSVGSQHLLLRMCTTLGKSPFLRGTPFLRALE